MSPHKAQFRELRGLRSAYFHVINVNTSNFTSWNRPFKPELIITCYHNLSDAIKSVTRKKKLKFDNFQCIFLQQDMAILVANSPCNFAKRKVYISSAMACPVRARANDLFSSRPYLH